MLDPEFVCRLESTTWNRAIGTYELNGKEVHESVGSFGPGNGARRGWLRCGLENQGQTLER